MLPEPIRARRDKCGFDDIYGLGFGRNLPHLERMVRGSGLRDLGVLDADRLVSAMRDAALGVGDLRAREHIDKALALVAWFEQYRRGPAADVLAERRLVLGGQAGVVGAAAPVMELAHGV